MAALLVAAPAAQARDVVVNSFDGTPIVAHFFPAPGASAADRAPTILVGHGWGGSGATGPPGEYASAGYNVLTWDARGFGGSGGTVMIDHPEFEARDAQALIDFVAQQPEAELDKPGDPRVGMDGPSYGGGVQFATAARDRRIDAITPTIAWNSLVTSLYKSNSIKLGWSLALAGLGIPTSLLPGIISPAGIQLGHQSPQFFNLVTAGVTGGRFAPAEVAWLDEHGPRHQLPQLRAPTLIVQGTVDTLFTLDEAHRNFTALKAQGVPVKMLWVCGGHGLCLTESDADGGNLASSLGGGGKRATEAKLDWFARHLKGSQSVSTGPEFEWIDEEGTYHGSAAYPLRSAGEVTGSGSGTIPLIPGVNPSGVLIFATPALPAPPTLTIPVPAPPAGSHVVGEPRLDVTYSATGVSLAADGKTHVYAQLVDKQRNIVVNNQATPIPISLDGASHKISVGLERIASKSTAAGYELQLIPQTTMYDAQRATGAVTIENARIALPLTEPVSACSNRIRGNKKRNKLRGTPEPDLIKGKRGNDRLKGLGGADCLLAGKGKDKLAGGEGDDVLRARGGGRDKLNCGPGRDTAYLTRKQDKVSGCEVLRRGKKRKQPRR
jgi:ABC-2 type transport system ATP-binding protein